MISAAYMSSMEHGGAAVSVAWPRDATANNGTDRESTALLQEGSLSSGTWAERHKHSQIYDAIDVAVAGHEIA